MTDAINYAVLGAVEEGPLPVGFMHQTFAPVAGRDIVLQGGSFMRSAYPALEGRFRSPATPETAFVASKDTGYATPVPIRKTVHVNGRVFGITAASSLYELVAGSWVIRTVSGIPTPNIWDICYLSGAYYLISSGTIYKSVDGLASATTVGANYGFAARIIAFNSSLIVLTYNPYTAYYYVGDGRVQRSDDGGATFTTIHTYTDGAATGGAGAGWHSSWRSSLFVSGGRLYAAYRYTIGESGFAYGGSSSVNWVWPAGVPSGPPTANMGVPNILNIAVDDDGRFFVIASQGSTLRANAFKAGTTTATGAQATLNVSSTPDTAAVRFFPAGFAYGALTVANSENATRYWHVDAELILSGGAITANNLTPPVAIQGIGHAASKALVFGPPSSNPNLLTNDATGYLLQFVAPNVASANGQPFYMRAR